MTGREPIDMTGGLFGVLRVIGEDDRSMPRNKIFVVQCVRCSKTKSMSGGNIRRGVGSATGGCKCIRWTIPPKQITHGMSGHPAYSIWVGMIARCYNRKHVAFNRYGGRGIDVCVEWRDTPIDFIGWMEAKGWISGLEVDRIDNDQGYSPSNCRIVSPKVNANNKSNNRRLIVDGESLTVAEAARRFGISKTTIKERLNRGWGDADAVRTSHAPAP